MTNQEILNKAIEKAIVGEFDMFGIKTVDWRVLDSEADEPSPGYVIAFRLMDKKNAWFCTSNDIIFNHDFAKALWGEDIQHSYAINSNVINKILFHWQHHLQQMVIAEDPIKYLGANI